MAAGLKRALDIEIEQVEGDYGEFTVLVDNEPVIAAGVLGFLGVLPGAKAIRQAIEPRLGRTHKA